MHISSHISSLCCAAPAHPINPHILSASCFALASPSRHLLVVPRVSLVSHFLSRRPTPRSSRPSRIQGTHQTVSSSTMATPTQHFPGHAPANPHDNPVYHPHNGAPVDFQPQPQHPMMPAQQPAPPPPQTSEWNAGLCGCCSPCSSCFLACCLPCLRKPFLSPW